MDTFSSEPWTNTSMVRILRLTNDKHYGKHDVMQFDSCENCLQSVFDYILAKRAGVKGETE